MQKIGRQIECCRPSPRKLASSIASAEADAIRCGQCLRCTDRAPRRAALAPGEKTPCIAAPGAPMPSFQVAEQARARLLHLVEQRFVSSDFLSVRGAHNQVQVVPARPDEHHLTVAAVAFVVIIQE